MPVHRIVMTWPETLESFVRRGLLPGPAGGRPPGGSEEERAALCDELLAATSWRPPARSRPDAGGPDGSDGPEHVPGPRSA